MYKYEELMTYNIKICLIVYLIVIIRLRQKE